VYWEELTWEVLYAASELVGGHSLRDSLQFKLVDSDFQHQTTLFSYTNSPMLISLCFFTAGSSFKV